LKTSVLSLKRQPIGYLEVLVTLIYGDVITVNDRHL
jgi:hypothetical protein